MPLLERAQEISVFMTSSGLYLHKVKPFGLQNAPATFFELRINMVVGDLEGCTVCLDGVVIHSDTYASYIARIRSLFQHLAAANVTIYLANCEFACGTVTYLGQVVAQDQVWAVHAKVVAVNQFPALSTKKGLICGSW